MYSSSSKKVRHFSQHYSPNASINASPMASTSTFPYLAITMQLESSAREIHDTFEHVDNASMSGADGGDIQESTAVALHLCKRKVLKPYFLLLALLGWRPLIYPIAPEVTCFARLFNVTYTLFITLCILTGYVLQYASCFRQDGYPPYTDSNYGSNSHTILATESNRLLIDGLLNTTAVTNNKTDILLDNNRININNQYCSGNFISLYLIPDLLHFFAYIFVLHLMRTPECECLQNLLERVFLESTRLNGWKIAHKKLVRTLRSFLWLCFAWVLLSVLGHTLHIFAFKEICFTWIEPNSKLLNQIMIGFTIISITWNDVICAAIVTSYLVQCQLNIAYIRNLVLCIREKSIDFQQFSKRVSEAKKFVDFLNGDQAIGVSLLIANFGCRAIVALFGLLTQQILLTADTHTSIIIVTSSVLWISLLALPIIQAVRLTTSCQKLRVIGHELRSRPFGYQDTPQQDLDSFLLYSSNIRMKAKLLNIPISGSGVLTLLILTIFVLLFLGQINVFKF